MDDELTLRPEVRWFAEAVERQLRKHDHDRGNSWKSNYKGPLLLDLYRKVAGLNDALAAGDKGRILEAVGSVGAHAMFIADVAGSLIPPPPIEE